MNTHIPTIHDLNRKTVRELHVMFREAATVAASERFPAQDREAAQRALDLPRRCLAAKVPRP